MRQFYFEFYVNIKVDNFCDESCHQQWVQATYIGFMKQFSYLQRYLLLNDIFSFCIKGRVQRESRPPVSSFEPAWAPDQWVKIFLIFVKILLSYSNCSGYHTAQSQSPCGIILCRVNLPSVSYCKEFIAPQYDTVGSQVTFLNPI